LMRIAAALTVSISDLFEESIVAPHHVLTRSARPALPIAENYRKTLLSRRPVREFEVYVGEFGPGGSTGDKPYVHGQAHEMFLVLRGQVELTLGDVEYIMQEGDSIEYPTSTPHKTRNIGDADAEVLWIISPPTSGLTELEKYNPGKTLATGDEAASGPRQKGNDDDDGKSSD
jgi:mannose-6-phosphate isomerase-like protein (cupin superfamily)